MITEEELIAQWEVDAKLNKTQLADETLRIASLHPKYLRLLMEAKRDKAKAERVYARTEHLMTQYYQGALTKEEMDKYQLKYDPYNGQAKPLKNKMGPWIDNDPRMRKAREDKQQATDIVLAIEEILNTIRWRHNAIKNISDVQRFEAGY